MIDLTVVPEVRERAARRAAELGLVIPTFAQMRSPESVPNSIKDQLARTGLWDLHPANLFRVTWRNQPVSRGGGFGGLNYLEFPPELTGVPARIAALVGKWFPTGAHKVGAAFGCLAPRLVTGQFDPTRQLAAWPSTGNYCRGGAYDSRILSCRSIAILPEGMSRERFEWLDTVADEVIATPGSESNVKEIFDKCWELRRSGRDIVIFNQFDEFGNYLWHYSVTGPALAQLAEELMGPGDSLAGVALTTGSSGTLASGDLLKEQHPYSRIAAAEALQCPTMLRGGFGEHRIEGIGDKHIPWIHNVRNTDMVIAIDDAAPLGLIRLFNEPAGRDYLSNQGVPSEMIESLDLLGISGAANLLSAVKMARWYELGPGDLVLTILTDSMDLYRSRLVELTAAHGELTTADAAGIYHRYLLGASTDHMAELSYPERRRIHSLKYFTWVEQQGKSASELEDQWYDPGYWENVRRAGDEIDPLIDEFNQLASQGV